MVQSPRLGSSRVAGVVASSARFPVGSVAAVKIWLTSPGASTASLRCRMPPPSSPSRLAGSGRAVEMMSV
eukprot:7388348-Pyramimonas_sp.AAC.1